MHCAAWLVCTLCLGEVSIVASHMRWVAIVWLLLVELDLCHSGHVVMGSWKEALRITTTLLLKRIAYELIDICLLTSALDDCRTIGLLHLLGVVWRCLQMIVPLLFLFILKVHHVAFMVNSHLLTWCLIVSTYLITMIILSFHVSIGRFSFVTPWENWSRRFLLLLARRVETLRCHVEVLNLKLFNTITQYSVHFSHMNEFIVNFIDLGWRFLTAIMIRIRHLW